MAIFEEQAMLQVGEARKLSFSSMLGYVLFLHAKPMKKREWSEERVSG